MALLATFNYTDDDTDAAHSLLCGLSTRSPHVTLTTFPIGESDGPRTVLDGELHYYMGNDPGLPAFVVKGEHGGMFNIHGRRADTVIESITIH